MIVLFVSALLLLFSSASDAFQLRPPSRTSSKDGLFRDLSQQLDEAATAGDDKGIRTTLHDDDDDD